MLSSAVPEAFQLPSGTNEAIALIKPWQELLLDYISLLGVVTAGFAIYSISLTSTAERVQCIPVQSLLNISHYTSLKNYVNAECSRDEKVRRFVGYPYFLLLIWFCLGLCQLWHKIPSINEKVEAFYKSVREITKVEAEHKQYRKQTTAENQMENNTIINTFEQFLGLFASATVYPMFAFKAVTQFVLCFVYFCIEGSVFGWNFMQKDASFTCTVSSRDVQQAKCLFLPLLAVQGVSGASFAIFIIFCMIFLPSTIWFLLCKRKWFSKADFPLDVIATRAANRSYLEFSFLMNLLKQHSNLYKQVLETTRLFLPCYLFINGSLKRTIANTRKNLAKRNGAAAGLFSLLQGCMSGQIRLVTMKEKTNPNKFVPYDNPVYLYCELYLRKVFRNFGLDFVEDKAKRLEDCLKENGLRVEGSSQVTFPETDRKDEERVLTTAAKANNAVLIVADVYTPISDPDWSYLIELRYTLPDKLSRSDHDASRTIVLCRLGDDKYKTLKAIDTADRDVSSPQVPAVEQIYVHPGCNHQIVSADEFNRKVLFRHYLRPVSETIFKTNQIGMQFLPHKFFERLFCTNKKTSNLEDRVMKLKDKVTSKVTQIPADYSTPWEKMVAEKLDLPLPEFRPARFACLADCLGCNVHLLYHSKWGHLERETVTPAKFGTDYVEDPRKGVYLGLCQNDKNEMISVFVKEREDLPHRNGIWITWV